MSRRTLGWSAVALVAAVVVWTAGQAWGLDPETRLQHVIPIAKYLKDALPAATQPAKSDQERMVGNWFITNDDSMRKGEMWVITEDSILMHAKDGGANAQLYSHRLDAGKDPRQIDITVTKVNGPPIGIMRGIYALDGDELRLCLGGLDKDRPTAFPKKPGPGEVLILQRATSGATPPKAAEPVKDAPAAGEPAAPAPPAKERKSN